MVSFYPRLLAPLVEGEGAKSNGFDVYDHEEVSWNNYKPSKVSVSATALREISLNHPDIF